MSPKAKLWFMKSGMKMVLAGAVYEKDSYIEVQPDKVECIGFHPVQP